MSSLLLQQRQLQLTVNCVIARIKLHGWAISNFRFQGVVARLKDRPDTPCQNANPNDVQNLMGPPCPKIQQ